MLIGNIVGSNLFNLTFVAGIAGVVASFVGEGVSIPVNAKWIEVEFPAMLLATVALWWFLRRDAPLTRRMGALLLAFYATVIGLSLVLHS